MISDQVWMISLDLVHVLHKHLQIAHITRSENCCIVIVVFLGMLNIIHHSGELKESFRLRDIHNDLRNLPLLSSMTNISISRHSGFHFQVNVSYIGIPQKHNAQVQLLPILSKDLPVRPKVSIHTVVFEVPTMNVHRINNRKGGIELNNNDNQCFNIQYIIKGYRQIKKIIQKYQSGKEDY